MLSMKPGYTAGTSYVRKVNFDILEGQSDERHAQSMVIHLQCWRAQYENEDEHFPIPKYNVRPMLHTAWK